MFYKFRIIGRVWPSGSTSHRARRSTSSLSRINTGHSPGVVTRSNSKVGVGVVAVLGVLVLGLFGLLQSCSEPDEFPPTVDHDSGSSFYVPDTGNNHPGPGPVVDSGYYPPVEDEQPTGDADCREFIQVGHVYELSNFSDLDGLDCVDRIGGDLLINAPDITSISLPKLKEVGGNIIIGSSMNEWINKTLATVTFSSLETIGGNLTIRGNPALTTVNLPELVELGGDLTVSEALGGGLNDKLATLSLPRVNTIGGTITVRRNGQLSQVDMVNLNFLGDSMVFYGNHKLCRSALQRIADRLRTMGWTGDLTLLDNGNC